MSFTELQVIHRHVAGSKTEEQQQQQSQSSGNGRFFLPQNNELYDSVEDVGLTMKIDSKLSPMEILPRMRAASLPAAAAPTTTTTGSSPSAVRPSAVSSQLCGQSHEVTGWVLRGALFLQTAHIPFIKLTHKMSDSLQRQARLLMPLVFYTSLLVLVAQLGAVVTLFAQSFMPPGMWFLLACIAILAGMFGYTAVYGNPHNQHLSRPLSPTIAKLLL